MVCGTQPLVDFRAVELLRFGRILVVHGSTALPEGCGQVGPVLFLGAVLLRRPNNKSQRCSSDEVSGGLSNESK